jgi:Methyltransferase domain
MGLRTFLGLKRPVKGRPHPTPPVNAVLQQRASETSADFIAPYLGSAILFKQRDAIRTFALDEAPKDGLLLEFGVYRGESINSFAGELTGSGDRRKIYGFDAFQGFQEHWTGGGHHKSRTHFNRGGAIPRVAPNVEIVPGWISDTLPGFLERNPGPIAMLHIDTDTYPPAKSVLSLCKSRLVKGSVILFDELLDYPGWELGEYKALTEEIPEECYEWIGFVAWRAALRIKKTVAESGAEIPSRRERLSASA